MSKLTTAQKNELIKSAALAAIAMPEGAIQFGDWSFAIPVNDDEGQRFVKMVLTSANNKDTKTAPAFDPERAQAAWLSEKATKEVKKTKKSKKSKKSTKSTDSTEEVTKSTDSTEEVVV